MLIRPLNKPDNVKNISNKFDIPQKPLNQPNIQSQANLKNQDLIKKSATSIKNSNNKITNNFRKDIKPLLIQQHLL